MAEILVNYVVNKLGDAVLKEIFFLCGVKEKVKQVKRELKRIRCFLRDADRKQSEDEMVRNWVNEMRELSHWIEDSVDLFVLEFEESSREYPDSQKSSKKEKIKRWLKKPEKIVRIHKFGKEMDKIHARILEITASREKYGIENLGEGSGSGVFIPFKRPIIPDLDETEPIGVKAEKEKIVAQLLDESNLRRSVVSIVGPGGLGKSTVAQRVFSSEEVKSKFDVRIWLSISQNFTLLNLLKKMLKEIGSLASDDDEDELKKGLKRSLREKKYLIVLDDVWSENLWPQIDAALPEDNNGSRVLITSRFDKVHKIADPLSKPNNLRFLDDKESLELLLKTALRNGDGTELMDIAKQLAHKCYGLPLALVALGGLLSTKPSTYHEWDKVLRTLVWSVHGKSCMDILTTSYDDMSVTLKYCFMYLACFPENYEIDADTLIQLWVAEGLIPPHDPHLSSQTLEDIAEDYLEELAQRSMVQVLKRSPWGSIETCGLHDLMRDVAIQKANEDNFLMVCSSGDVEQSCGRARRLAVHHYDCEVMKHASSNLRSFLCFNDQIQSYSGNGLLQVLHYEFDSSLRRGGFVKLKELERIGRLTQLRYLCLDGLSRQNDEQHFHKLIGGLKHLQTLACLFLGCSLPECIWHVKTLRHVILYENVPGSSPSADLKNLQTLWGVHVPKSWETTALPSLPNLRTLKLNLQKSEGSSWAVHVAFLRTLKNLYQLIIEGEEIPTEIIDMRDFPFYYRLKYLFLDGRICSSDMQMVQLDAAMFPVHLTALGLSLSKVKQDVMHVLEKLQGLKQLSLGWKSCDSNKLRCSARGFPQLENLSIYLGNWEEWEIEEGAMPVLENLKVIRNYTCPMIRGLDHLPALRNLTWSD